MGNKIKTLFFYFFVLIDDKICKYKITNGV